ncbi:MAG: hypothetical protein RNU03_13130 [Candidatus Sedimenticola sp. (ex Thyasira tokunagai)]
MPTLLPLWRAARTTGKQCGLTATGDYQPSLRSPWLAAVVLYHLVGCRAPWPSALVYAGCRGRLWVESSADRHPCCRSCRLTCPKS